MDACRHNELPLNNLEPLESGLQTPALSHHAKARCAQRAVNPELINFVLHWGREIYQRDGRMAYHIGKREARALRGSVGSLADALEDLAVVMCSAGVVLTVIRSPNRHRLNATYRPLKRSNRGQRVTL